MTSERHENRQSQRTQRSAAFSNLLSNFQKKDETLRGPSLSMPRKPSEPEPDHRSASTQGKQTRGTGDGATSSSTPGAETGGHRDQALAREAAASALNDHKGDDAAPLPAAGPPSSLAPAPGTVPPHSAWPSVAARANSSTAQRSAMPPGMRSAIQAGVRPQQRPATRAASKSKPAYLDRLQHKARQDEEEAKRAREADERRARAAKAEEERARAERERVAAERDFFLHLHPKTGLTLGAFGSSDNLGAGLSESAPSDTVGASTTNCGGGGGDDDAADETSPDVPHPSLCSITEGPDSDGVDDDDQPVDIVVRRLCHPKCARV